MKKNYTFSNLPMAAIVLLVASLPCLAQVTANDSSVIDNSSTLALNKTLSAVPNSSDDILVTSKSVDRVKSPLNLSPATFKVSDQFSMDSKFFAKAQFSIEPVTLPDSKPQFRLDDYTPTKGSKVTFVPSRGYKIPQ